MKSVLIRAGSLTENHIEYSDFRGLKHINGDGAKVIVDGINKGIDWATK